MRLTFIAVLFWKASIIEQSKNGKIKQRMWYVKKHDNLYYIYRNMKKQKAFEIIQPTLNTLMISFLYQANCRELTSGDLGRIL